MATFLMFAAFTVIVAMFVSYNSASSEERTLTAKANYSTIQGLKKKTVQNLSRIVTLELKVQRLERLLNEKETTKTPTSTAKPSSNAEAEAKRA